MSTVVIYDPDNPKTVRASGLKMGQRAITIPESGELVIVDEDLCSVGIAQQIRYNIDGCLIAEVDFELGVAEFYELEKLVRYTTVCSADLYDNVVGTVLKARPLYVQARSKTS